MLIRFITALVGLPLLFAAVWIGEIWFSALVTLVAAVASIELTLMARRWGHYVSIPLVTVPVVALVAIAHVLSRTSVPPNAITFALAVLSVALLAWLVANRGRQMAFARPVTALAIILYAGGFLSHLPLLRALEQGREWVLFLLLVTFATDTSAYFVGKFIGRTPLAPSISPSKTIEGAVGGMIGAVGASLAANYVLGLNVSLWEALILGSLIGVVGQLGDLAESRIKRLADVKDSGALIPGHGGVLDRLDSIVLNLVVVYYFVSWETLQNGLSF
ncbi:MAG: hypothetical protein BZY79_06370 [SAR202 cluster bacterium Casp-Chloro-G4]|nr:phosphatidate cytidylyltransferase [Chloroflexota bacterium]PKB60963.1 MAG: hypothetical protein BZY79_06370 [SAR202 cluster bacterium Casp-Chloro-G4]